MTHMTLAYVHGLWILVGMAPPLARAAERSLGQSVIDWCAEARRERPAPSYADLAAILDSEHGIPVHPETLRRWCKVSA